MSSKDRAFPSGVVVEEDPIRLALLGKPHIHHAIHPSRHDSLLTRIWACRDALYDPHSDAVNLTKLTVLGAVVGGITGFTWVFLLKSNPSFAMRKAHKYIRENNFGTLYIYKEALMPYVLGGAATGFSYFMFWKVFWGQDVGKATSCIVGNGIFTALAVSALYSPKYWWAGLYAGALAGFAYHHVMFRNVQFGQKDFGNVQLKLSGLTEEEREKQKNKDIIQELGMNLIVEQNRLMTV